MKFFKTLKWSFAAIACLGVMNSCEGPMGPSGYDGRDGTNGKDGTNGFSNWKVKELAVHSDEWKSYTSKDSAASYFYYEYSDPALTAFIADSGLVTIYYKYDADSTAGVNWVYSPLPITRYYKTSTASWSETFDYDYAKNSVVFYMTRSNNDVTTKPSGPDYFKIVYNW